MGVFRQPARIRPQTNKRPLTWREGPGPLFIQPPGSAPGGGGVTFVQGINRVYAGPNQALSQYLLTPPNPGDIIVYPQQTQVGTANDGEASGGNFPLQVFDDTTFAVLPVGPSGPALIRQYFFFYVYRRATGSYDGPGLVYIGEVPPQWGAFSFPAPFAIGQPIVPINLNGSPFAISPLGDPLTFAVSAGALPTGLVLNATTGIITGTPTAGGGFSVQFTATDFAGFGTASQTVQMGVTQSAVGFIFSGAQISRHAHQSGQLQPYQSGQFIAPAPRVKSRTIQWETVVRMAGGRVEPHPYEVYRFGGGEVQSSFYEDV